VSSSVASSPERRSAPPWAETVWVPCCSAPLVVADVVGSVMLWVSVGSPVVGNTVGSVVVDVAVG